MFRAWGALVYRWRWAILPLSALVLVVSILVLRGGGNLTNNQASNRSLQAVQTERLINAELTSGQASGSSFLLIFRSPTLAVASPAFRSEMQAELAPLQADPRVAKLITPYNAPTSAVAAALTSKDGREALAEVSIRSSGSQATADYVRLRSELKATALRVEATGQVPINHAFNTTLEGDLHRAEEVSLPIALLLLLLIFASVVAAGLPLLVGALAILGGIGGTLLLSRYTDVSQYALNIVTLIGLGVAIDYSLFVVNRFRDELAAGQSRADALAVTMATAGRAITFSGFTVAIGLSAMLFYQGTFLASLGAAGAIVVAAAVFYGLTFLPALLALLGPRVNWLPIPYVSRRKPAATGFWHAFAGWVMRRPLFVLVPTLLFLLALGTPFLHIRLANGSVDELPPGIPARQAYDDLVHNFPGQDENDFAVVVHYSSGSPLTPGRIRDQYTLSRRLARIPGILRVESIYSSPHLSAAAYAALYSGPASGLPSGVSANLKTYVGSHLVLFTALSNQPASSDAARAILKQIRALHVGNGGQVLVTGETPFDVDTINFILAHTPVAVAFVVLVTYLILFLLTGSLVLPLKAVVLNLISLSAAFGALVWIFQDGHLSQQLAFTPQSLDPSIPVLLFAIVFGMSMDYEVLLVSRIHEEYSHRRNNTEAVALGLERSGRLITGAAAIMVSVFAAFGLAQVVLIKSIGLGLGIAVALDATVVRALVVPAVMRLLGDYNWWSPAWLRRLHARSGLAEYDAPLERAA